MASTSRKRSGGGPGGGKETQKSKISTSLLTCEGLTNIFYGDFSSHSHCAVFMSALNLKFSIH